jgi:uncharacterized protein YxjI
MLLDKTKFAVKSQSVGFAGKKAFEILDTESGKPLATAKDTTPFLSSLIGSTIIEVRDVASNDLLFTLSRTGFPIKKDEVRDAKGEVVGRYKAKVFSIGGGFHMYDKEGKHLGEIRGQMFKAEYKFVTPDKGTEMGTVSRTWSGLAKSMFTGSDTYGVQVDPKFATDARAKMLMLGATIAVESIFKKKKGSSTGGGGGGGGGDE